MDIRKRIDTIINEAEQLSSEFDSYEKDNDWAIDRLRRYNDETNELKREIIYIIFWSVVLICVCTACAFLLGRRSMTVPDKTPTEQTTYPITPLMEQHDSYDDELTAVMPFNRFVDLYPRLVENHDKDFVQQALDGKKIYAISCYFVRKPE